MKTTLSRLAPLALLPLALALSAADAGAAQKKAASPFQGFSSDSGKPVDVKSDSLEVHQDEQKAIFTGNVVATQGDSVLHTNELTVFYDNSVTGGASGGGKKADKTAAADGSKPADPAAKPADAQPAAAATDQAAATGKPAVSGSSDQGSSSGQSATGAQANSIKKLIAKGNVVVTSKDQKATGDYGVMDMATNLATLTGNEVVMIQGPNVLKGKKLVVNLKTGVSNVQGGGAGGVSGVFTQSNDQKKNAN